MFLCVFFLPADPRGMKSWFLQVPVDFGAADSLQGPGTSGLADRSELQHCRIPYHSPKISVRKMEESSAI